MTKGFEKVTARQHELMDVPNRIVLVLAALADGSRALEATEAETHPHAAAGAVAVVRLATTVHVMARARGSRGQSGSTLARLTSLQPQRAAGCDIGVPCNIYSIMLSQDVVLIYDDVILPLFTFLSPPLLPSFPFPPRLSSPPFLPHPPPFSSPQHARPLYHAAARRHSYLSRDACAEGWLC